MFTERKLIKIAQNTARIQAFHDFSISAESRYNTFSAKRFSTFENVSFVFRKTCAHFHENGCFFSQLFQTGNSQM